MTGDPMRKVLWQDMLRDEIDQVAKGGGVAVVPLGATEQHGPHLPLSTDIHTAWQIARRAAERITSFPVVVAPPVWWGLSPENMVFSGTLTLRVETLLALVTDLCQCIRAHGFDRIVLLNGHGNNPGWMSALAARLNAEGTPVAAVTYWDLILPEMAAIAERDLADVNGVRIGRIGHAGEFETSIQMFLQPELVDVDAIAPGLGNPINGAWRSGRLVAGYVAQVLSRDCPSGVIGDPTVATAKKGAQTIEAAVHAAVEFIEAYRRIEWDPSWFRQGAPSRGGGAASQQPR